ncbi:hypothetical protein TRV_05445 [Trichophyton verrucosum HKI 0517]|uniref:JmjC domain-containing protein n=1 Tax=Trichophyton verrucosum (strain HKI 0517) TaxID=663202 RepID=D4DE78_TRIVH|nr:uncharacterized protein TRV_05445 [Trichophyton verrucosum HKI 0517]EFE39860.1 hypothetical protein TRV_05445 [Trichophyton verrucosum HKI 0517]
MTGSAALRYLALDTLATDCVALFRESCFKAQRPVVLPRGLFRNYRAVSRWFDPPPSPHPPPPPGAASSAPASNPGLNYAYLEQHGDCYVPLELTIPGGRDGIVFERAHRPLSLFLQWTRSVQSTPAAEAQDGPRLYLAQCQLLDLPGSLREDFPTPSYVMQAGKGDIYDTNIWVGLAPTYTPLHRDPNPNLFVQLAGSKHVRLLAPDVGRGVFAQVRETLDSARTGHGCSSAIRGDEMMKGAERQLLDHAVWDNNNNEHTSGTTQENVGYDAILQPGDALFIPTGWWHSIKGVGQGITASVSIPKTHAISTETNNNYLTSNRSTGGSGEPKRNKIKIKSNFHYAIGDKNMHCINWVYSLYKYTGP